MVTDTKFVEIAMPLETSPYLDPNDRGYQGHLPERIGIAEVDSGICLSLVIRWAITCIEKHPIPPNEVWHSMKANGPAYFKQIARNHQAYKTSIEGTGLAFDAQVNKQLLLESKNSYHTVVGSGSSGPYSYLFSTRMQSAVSTAWTKSDVTPHIALIVFSSEVGGHAVGAAKPPVTEGEALGTNYLYDPNFGVFRTNSSAQWNTLLNNLFESYHIVNGYALPMIHQ